MYLRILLFSLLSMCFFDVYSQSYNFEVAQGSYEDLEGSISLNGNMTWDDPDYLIPIGFDFEFFDFQTENLLLTGLGSDIALTLSFEDELPIMIPFGADIIDRGYDIVLGEPTLGSQSNISYLLVGAEGNRILKVEWKNVGFYDELDENGVSNDFANFQLWLYEGSNNFEIHFGESSVNYPEFSFDIGTGPLVLFDPAYNIDWEELSENALVLTGDPSSPELFIGPINLEDAYLEGMIPNGTIFSFINPTSSTVDQVATDITIDIFPNPAGDLLNYSFNDFLSELTSVTISNMAGQKIVNFINPTSPLNISNLNPGMYILTINTTEGIVSKKLIKN